MVEEPAGNLITAEQIREMAKMHQAA
jgi:hypothetical protein